MPTHGEIKRCDSCGHVVSKRRIVIYVGIIRALKRVFQWCEVRGVHEFARKDIKHLMENENDTARFGDLVMFGGLVYKHGKGHYGLNMERCKAFFNGEYPIPIAVWKDPVTKELKPDEYRTINRIPCLSSFLNEQNEFIAKYAT